MELGPGAALTSQSLWSASKADLRTEHYVTYTPNSTLIPMVFSGSYVASTNTVHSAASQLEAQGWRVAAAINGGFFNADGTIVGMLMTDGVLRALDVANYTLLGFTADGRVFIDESKPTVSAAWTGFDGMQRVFPIAGFNAYRNNNYLDKLYLYNQDFSSKVTSGGPCVSAILRPVNGEQMRMNRTLTLEVVSVADAVQDQTIFNGILPEGCYMLYAEDRNNPELLSALRELVPGTQVSIAVGGASEQWDQAVYGISGLYTLLRDGQLTDGLPTSANPYTAVGLKGDGTAVFYTIDGRQGGYSVGATYTQVAQRLQELGCVSAVALDGGGSTTLGATLPGGGFEVVNKPSTANRKINNTIALVSRAGESLFIPGAYVNAQTRVVLTGASLNVTAAPYDSAGRPVSGQFLSWNATGGSVFGTESGAVYTAGQLPGSYTVSAGPGSPLSVEVVDKLSALNVTRKDSSAKVDSLNLEPGEQVELTASGVWYNLPVSMDADDITWAADPAVGAIDTEGRFTAGTANGQGNITVTAGGVTVSIPVQVDRGDPFTDMAGHWSADYVTRLYKLGLTTGYGQEDGTALFKPQDRLTRAELLAFITRVLGVDESAYYTVELPFADNTDIPNWAQNYVQAMYTLGVLKGSNENGVLYANVNGYVTREETMTILGRILASSQSCDLSQFPDSALVSDWAAPHVQTLVALNIVGGSNGLLSPKDYIDRAAIAKLLVEVYPLEKALLIPRLDLMT
ncbi:MAG: hypothetical protein HFF25_01735 [Oscillospiraceae bacterium]|nr:hypothetical protein [Oscillospiraceae bacterium]